MKIIARSFDFDGCLYPDEFYLSEVMHGNICLVNRALFHYLAEENKNYAKRISLIGSSRQSKGIDDFNIKEKNKVCQTNQFPGKGESCFVSIKKVAKELDSEFDSILLADIHRGLQAGESINRAQSKYAELIEHPEILFYMDIGKNKTSIAYAQIQKLAQDFPNDEVSYDFYDDREDVLNILYDFFSKHPEKIPTNVTLNLKQYVNTEMPHKLVLYPAVIGKGTPEKDYRDKVAKNTYQAYLPYRTTGQCDLTASDKTEVELPTPALFQSFGVEKIIAQSEKTKSIIPNPFFMFPSLAIQPLKPNPLQQPTNNNNESSPDPFMLN